MRIAIAASNFMGWSGGIDFIFNIYRGLKYLKDNGQDLDLYLFIPKESGLLEVLKKTIRTLTGIKTENADSKLLSIFSNTDIKICYYNKNTISRLGIVDHGKGLSKALKKNGIDIILPLLDYDCEYENLGIPCIAYIYDFQHKYLPELFTQDSIKKRDREFDWITSKAAAIVVNAQDVKNDIRKLYPESQSKIYVLPFSPIISERWLDIIENNKLDSEGLSLNPEIKKFGKYFIICNQFWKHKDHYTAFEAFEKFYNKGHSDYHLVTTGLMKDDRFPDYIEEIKNKLSLYNSRENIHMLGFVDKNYQVELLYNAIAVVQPTRFEGGPGGGVCYDGLSLGNRCIVSDLEVNKEIPDNYPVTFFNTGNSDALYEKLEEVSALPIKRSDVLKLREQRKYVIQRYSDYIFKMIKEESEDYKNRHCNKDILK